jgi:hypothetical protein
MIEDVQIAVTVAELSRAAYAPSLFDTSLKVIMVA